MDVSKINSLVELYFKKVEQIDKKKPFLKWLNPNNNKTFTWEETKNNIFKLSKIIKENIKEGDRCLLVSENRPEWFVSDLAIMLSGGITVPAYTTYTEEDYKYLIEDCEPALVIVSNNEMLKKLNNTINEKLNNLPVENIEAQEKLLNMRQQSEAKLNVLLDNWNNLREEMEQLSILKKEEDKLTKQIKDKSNRVIENDLDYLEKLEEELSEIENDIQKLEENCKKI